MQYLDEVTLPSVSESENEIRLQGRRNNEDFSVRAKFVVDATGPRGFLHHALALQESPLPDFPATQALFSHFTGVARFAEQISDHASELPPYPVDDAAVHHIFDGGWIWVLQFNNGITSAGVAATDELAGSTALVRRTSSLATAPGFNSRLEESIRKFPSDPALHLHAARFFPQRCRRR